MIELKQVTKQYGQATVLKNITLSIGEPGIYCLLGRNGAGKTTLLKSIAGYQNITSGSIQVDGKAITTSTLDTGVSYIENFAKHFNLPVRKLLRIASEVNPNYDDDFASEMMERFELDGKKKFHHLSLGMKTMVSTIICLASNKEVILLDEPVLGFDAIMRVEFYDMLTESFQKHPRMIIVSTHIIEEIAKTIQKLIIIDKGSIRFFDTLQTDGGTTMKKMISLALCLLLGCFVLAGCSNSSEPFEEKSYTPDTPIHEIHLDVQDREIEVSLSEDEQVHIQYYENSKEYYDISVSDDNVLTMASASDKEWTDYIGGKPSAENRKISLQIPDALLDTLTLSTTNEDIFLPALAVTGSINISSNGGNISFGNLDVGSALTLNVKNGDISGAIVGSYDDFSIQSEIKKGESNLPDKKDGGEKALTVSSNNGDVNIEFVDDK